MFGFILGFMVLTSTSTGNKNNATINDFNYMVQNKSTMEKALFITAPNGAPYVIGKLITNGLKKYAVITRKMDFTKPIYRKGEIVGYPYETNIITKIKAVDTLTEPEIKLNILCELGISTKTVEVTDIEVVKTTGTPIGSGGFIKPELIGLIAIASAIILFIKFPWNILVLILLLVGVLLYLKLRKPKGKTP